MELYRLRTEVVGTIIDSCEKYLSTLANAPRELSKSVGELKAEFASFKTIVDTYEKQAYDMALKAGGTAAAATAAGVGVAAFGPSAALAIATTFGTASTGTAISALSGAAATKAALAWLGGGALAAGGGGMAAGKALLALAGPVGWAIGGLGLVTALGMTSRKNKAHAKEATQKTAEIREHVNTLILAEKELDELLKLTDQHASGVQEQLHHLTIHASHNYDTFRIQDKERLGALINNVNSLSELLNRRIEISSPNAQERTT